MKNNSSIRKILVQRADRLGDVIFTFPFLEAVATKYPEAEIHFLSAALGSQLIGFHPLITKVHTVQTLIRSSEVFKTLLNEIEAENYDQYYCLWNNLSMAYLGVKAGIPCRVGGDLMLETKFFYTQKINQKLGNHFCHETDFNLAMLGERGPAPRETHQLLIPEKATKNAEALLEEQGYQQQPIMMIMVSTGGSNFFMPKALIETLGERLIESGYFVILAGQSDLSFEEKDNQLNVINQTQIPELMALIKRTDYYIGGDTGPTHIAAHFNKPILFFSARKINHPSRWGPRCEYFEIFREDYRCPNICQNSDCDPKSCLAHVQLEPLDNMLKKLILRVKDKKALSIKEQQQRFQLNATRVLYFPENEAQDKFAEMLADDGLNIVSCMPEEKHSLRKIIETLLTYNCTVIQGPGISKWKVRLIQFYIKNIFQYIPPIYLTDTFQEGDLIKTWLNKYMTLWEQR